MLIYKILDVFFVLLHLVIIGFNLLGWIWRSTLRWHLLSIVVTAASWFLLGIWYGMGYCFITDWHWQIKRQLGAEDLPASFITWLAQQVWNGPVNPVVIDWLTAIGFALAVILSLYRNWKTGLLNWRK